MLPKKSNVQRSTTCIIQALFQEALESLSDYVTPELIATLARSYIAEWKSSSGTASCATSGSKEKEGKKARDKDKKGKEKETATVEKVEGDEPKRKSKEQARARWRAAIELWPSTSKVGEGELETSETSTKAEEEEASEGGQEAGGSKPSEDPPPTNRLTIFALSIRHTETTVSAIRDGNCSIGILFEKNVWNGSALFGRDPEVGTSSTGPILVTTSLLTSPLSLSAELDDEDLLLIDRVGGTFHLTSTAVDAKKLVRILELMAFALLSLKLEADLLRDTHSLRPPPDLDETSNAEEEEDVPPLPVPKDSRRNSLRARDEFPSEEWSVESREQKSRWSKGNLWGLLLGFQSGSSARRGEGATASSSSSMVSVPHSTRKVSDRIKGLRDGFKGRRDRSRRRRGSDFRRGPSMESEDGIDNGWDFIGGLGLGAFGPQSVGTVASRSASPEPTKEDATQVPTSAVVEEEPLDRFQNVIQKMQRCVTSYFIHRHRPPTNQII